MKPDHTESAAARLHRLAREAERCADAAGVRETAARNPTAEGAFALSGSLDRLACALALSTLAQLDAATRPKPEADRAA